MMKIFHRGSAGLTGKEVLVGVVVLAGLILSMRLFFDKVIVKGQMTSEFSNMKQLHLATQQMAVDGKAEDGTRIGWPGDTGGTFTNWAAQLVSGNYLSTNDLCKLLSAPGALLALGSMPIGNTNGVLVYAVSTNSPENTVFLSTRNFTNTPTGGRALSSGATPFGRHGFVVFYMVGNGARLRQGQVGDTNAVGAYVPLLR